MVKIVETNILMKDSNVADHQARVIQVDSWDTYVEMYESYSGEACGDFKSEYGNLIGNSLPKKAKIVELKYTEFNLKCKLKLWNDTDSIKLAYLLG